MKLVLVHDSYGFTIGIRRLRHPRVPSIPAASFRLRRERPWWPRRAGERHRGGRAVAAVEALPGGRGNLSAWVHSSRLVVAAFLTLLLMWLRLGARKNRLRHPPRGGNPPPDMPLAGRRRSPRRTECRIAKVARCFAAAWNSSSNPARTRVPRRPRNTPGIRSAQGGPRFRRGERKPRGARSSGPGHPRASIRRAWRIAFPLWVTSAMVARFRGPPRRFLGSLVSRTAAGVAIRPFLHPCRLHRRGSWVEIAGLGSVLLGQPHRRARPGAVAHASALLIDPLPPRPLQRCRDRDAGAARIARLPRGGVPGAHGRGTRLREGDDRGRRPRHARGRPKGGRPKGGGQRGHSGEAKGGGQRGQGRPKGTFWGRPKGGRPKGTGGQRGHSGVPQT
ncbi:hypothetical protein OJF2_31390 [Aquisphaera giovannonii]|uniref:Uncharacterized protein n=1 Tax=Aquisphaera giovannonii TaxID=406548 RepID=A0A5B9W232_9BACT|nr:hypothetical protein OJF2_31390 [Aquisphaera giovannonii]